MSAAPLLAGLLVVVVARPWATRSPARSRRTRTRSIGLDPVAFRWSVAALGTAAGFVLVGSPVAAVVGGLAGWCGPTLLAGVRARGRAAAIAAAVPEVVDLFLVAASAGQPVAGSLALVGPRAPSVVGPAVVAASGRFRRGLPLSDALAELGEQLGPTGVPLTEALRQAAAAGVPLVPLLEGVAASARDARRRRAQEVARRLPVTMLLPLVACILPAAILLAVVPVLLVSIASLSP
jgi:tight adherence protein C